MLVALPAITLDLAQVLYEMFAWEEVASPSSLHADISGDVTQAPPSTGKPAQTEL